MPVPPQVVPVPSQKPPPHQLPGSAVELGEGDGVVVGIMVDDGDGLGVGIMLADGDGIGLPIMRGVGCAVVAPASGTSTTRARIRAAIKAMKTLSLLVFIRFGSSLLTLRGVVCGRATTAVELLGGYYEYAEILTILLLFVNDCTRRATYGACCDLPHSCHCSGCMTTDPPLDLVKGPTVMPSTEPEPTGVFTVEVTVIGMPVMVMPMVVQ